MRWQTCLKLLFFAIFAKANADDDIYESSKDLCSRCDCKHSEDQQDTFKLDCSRRSFKNIINDWPEHPKILVASFSYNNITTLESLPGCDAQIVVSFDHCGIKNLETGLFENTVNIVYADLSYNLLTSSSLAADIFKGPYNNTVFQPIGLKQLNLAYNQIHSLPKDVFEHMPSLQVLNLEGNHFRVLDIVTQYALSSVPQLHILNLANNQLTDMDDDAVKNLKNLKEINLSKNDLDFVPETLSYVAGSLERLNLDENPIVKLTDNSFIGLGNVQELSLNHLSEITNINANTFAPLKKLKVLHLSNNNRLTEIDRQAFGEDQFIAEFYLQNNSLTSLHPELLPWSKLEVFEMDGNDFFCSCDLYNISQNLTEQIKRNKDGPACINPRKLITTQVYLLRSDVCFEQPTIPSARAMGITHHFNTMRVSLVTMSVILIISTMIAMWVGWSKWRSYQRLQNYPFVSNIQYNPLNTNIHL